MPLMLRPILLLVTLFLSSMAPAAAQVVEAKGAATISYAGKTLSVAERQMALSSAQLNAFERYVAEHNPSKQRLFEAAKGGIVSNLDSLLLSTTILSEIDDPSQRSYTVVVRAEINSGKLENALADASGYSPTQSNGSEIAVVVVSRAPASVQSFQDKVYSRSDVEAEAGTTASSKTTTREAENVRSSSVETNDSLSSSADARASLSVSQTSGGSVTRKADAIEWSVTPSSNTDQLLTGIMTEAGLNVVPAEFIEQLDLIAIRADFGKGDDLAPATLRGMVAAIKAGGLRYVTLGTMDVQLPDRDPVSGNVRVYVTATVRLLDLTGNFPRPVAAIGPIQYAGLGPTEAVARTEATKRAASEVAKTLVDQMAVKGIR